MTQEERRAYLIKYLLREAGKNADLPQSEYEQKRLLRGLMNVRPPKKAEEAFIKIQDEYLQEALRDMGITELSSLSFDGGGLALWKGDITTLAADAVVNAANSGLTGCYSPCHACIDNCIHTFAGVQLRLCCAEIIESQGHPEPTGQAKITPAYNLPGKYVIHTVGPIVGGRLTREHCGLLSSCYRSCLDIAAENGCESIAFCCISTGVFGFPKKEAAEIAVKTVKDWKAAKNSSLKVIFNVFGDGDLEIYRSILKSD